MRILQIITGMSGAGKSVVANKLEDLGYFCIDNLPPKLLDKLGELIENNPTFSKIALVVHAQKFDIDIMNKAIRGLKDKFDANVVFLDANNETLVSRYKETRRLHPFSHGESVLSGIMIEREMLTVLKDVADFHIDTTSKSAKDLNNVIEEMFKETGEIPFTVNFVSFGYKYGIPIDIDLAFDVRFLTNPHYIPDLKPKTGLDKEVYDYVIQNEDTIELLEKLEDLFTYLIPKYKEEGKGNLTIGIGCTGGRHRSVSIAEFFKDKFSDKYNTNVIHRDTKISK